MQFTVLYAVIGTLKINIFWKFANTFFYKCQKEHFKFNFLGSKIGQIGFDLVINKSKKISFSTVLDLKKRRIMSLYFKGLALLIVFFLLIYSMFILNLCLPYSIVVLAEEAVSKNVIK